MRRILLALAVALVMAAVAAPSALARQHFYCYSNSPGFSICYLSKKACQQAQANDPSALSECIKSDKI